MPARFDGKVALVIGGSSGIGLATVRGLLAEGGQVSIAARDAARLAAIGQELLDAHPGRVAWVSVYAATKGAVEAMSRVLAVELAPRKITVNCVAPGLTDTPMLGGTRDDPDRIRQIPMGRIGRPEEVAATVLFLASDDAGWVTGQTVDATGGYGL